MEGLSDRGTGDSGEEQEINDEIVEQGGEGIESNEAILLND